MAKYKIASITDGVAKVEYENGSWAELVLAQDMQPEDIDDLAHQYAPKTGTAPSFTSDYVGTSRDIVEKKSEGPVDNTPEYILNRLEEYGDAYSQIEYITENGLEAWQTKVAGIKSKYPKPS